MPKRTLTIGDFKGGINNVKSEKDIDPSESPNVINANFDDEGRIKMIGSATDQYLSFTENMTVTTEGEGFFAFSHDYTMLSDGSDTDSDGTTVAGKFLATPVASPTNYLVKENGGEVKIYDYSSGQWSHDDDDIDLPGSGYSPEFLFVNGSLRVVNKSDLTQLVQYIGHIKRELFKVSGATTGQIRLNKWWVGDARVLPPFYSASNVVLNPNTANDPTTSFYMRSLKLPDDNHGDAMAEWHAMPKNAGDGTVDHDFDGVVFTYQYVNDSDTASGNEKGTWSSAYSYQFYATALYDNGKQESKMNAISGAPTTPPNATSYLSCAVSVKPYTSTTTTVANQPSMSTISDRVSGLRIYYSSTADEYGEKFLLLDVDFEEGCRKAESTVRLPWSAFFVSDASGANTTVCPATAFDNSGTVAGKDSFLFYDPPTAATYVSQNGHEHSDIFEASFKTACVIGNRTFIGNIYQDGVYYGDRIIFSPGNQYDKYPADNKWDVAISDGESIIKLQEFGSTILCFKQSTLYVINLAEDLSPLSAKHPFKGIEKPYQVCKTPAGLYWVNKYGLFWYDGQQIINLMEGKLQRVKGTLSYDNSWNWTGYASIGYDEETHKLIILKDARASQTYSGDAWVYDIRLNSWMLGKGIIASGSKKTNWVNTPDGYLIYSVSGASTVSTVASGVGKTYEFGLSVKETTYTDEPYGGVQ